MLLSEELKRKRKRGLLQKQHQPQILDVKLCGTVVDSENKWNKTTGGREEYLKQGEQNSPTLSFTVSDPNGRGTTTEA